MKKSKSVKKPFFSKFLENNKLEQTTTIKGGGGPKYFTQKAPSDNDEI